MTKENADTSKNIVRDTGRVEDDERLSRASADNERTLEDGTALTMQERIALLRQGLTNDILPNVPNDGQYHYCWLSTNNQSDPIYRRLLIGYELVKREQMPKLALHSVALSAEYEGIISVNEMVLARMPLELYNELMIINHHERPLQEEELLKANAVRKDEDSEGNVLGEIEGEGIKNLGKRVQRPNFV